MEIEIIPYSREYVSACRAIWNRVVDDGVAFPQTEPLSDEDAYAFFSEQSFTGIARDKGNGMIVGLYILHPNNIGRCGHISNSSYAVDSDYRGMGVGEALVRHSLKKGKELGFTILQFNAVVSSNIAALSLYEKLGFVRLGTIPGGFLMKNGTYEDIILYYHLL